VERGVFLFPPSRISPLSVTLGSYVAGRERPSPSDRDVQGRQAAFGGARLQLSARRRIGASAPRRDRKTARQASLPCPTASGSGMLNRTLHGVSAKAVISSFGIRGWSHGELDSGSLATGLKVRTVSYMPGSKVANVSASCRNGSGPGSWRMD